jgi:putative ABC transport system permease protein
MNDARLDPVRTLLRLAWRNVGRQRVRSAVTIGAVAAGVAALILVGGFVQDIFVQLGEALIHSQSGHLQISREGYREAGMRQPERYVIDRIEPLRGRIAKVSGVRDVMARVQFAGLLNNGRRDFAIIAEGVEPVREARLGSSVRVVAGRALGADDAFGATIGKGLADALKLAPGDRATLVTAAAGGATNTLDLEIVGVFQTFSRDYDARAVRVPLAAAHEALMHAGANTLVLLLDRTEDTARVAATLRDSLADEGFEVDTWQTLNDFYDKTVELYERQFGVLGLIVLVMVVLGVSNSVNATLLERVGEFGTLRALGDPVRRVAALAMLEAAMMGLAGAALGVALGIAAALGLSALGIPMPPPPNADLGYVASIRIVPAIVAIAACVGIVATLLAALLPTWRAVRTPIAAALARNV